ncbi:CHAD domain-containing protein [Segnochrobactraceae bacterium EtOH-i3]
MKSRPATTPSTPLLVRRPAAEIRAAAAALSAPDLTREECVHRARRRLKAARSFLRVLRPVIDRAGYRFLIEELRAAKEVLSYARDADVAAATAADLAARAVRRSGHSSAAARAVMPLAALRDRLVVRAEEAHEETIPPEEVAAALVLLAREAERVTEGLALPAAPILKATRKAARAVRKARRRAARTGRDRDLHAWRKAVKHQAVLAGLVGPAELAEQLDHLGDLLGVDHDLAMLDGVLRSEKHLTQGKRPRRAVRAFLAGRRGRLQHRAFRLGRRVEHRSR